jgi:hypothetical protein
MYSGTVKEIFEARDLNEISLVAKALNFKLAVRQVIGIGSEFTLGIAIPILNNFYTQKNQVLIK